MTLIKKRIIFYTILLLLAILVICIAKSSFRLIPNRLIATRAYLGVLRSNIVQYKNNCGTYPETLESLYNSGYLGDNSNRPKFREFISDLENGNDAETPILDGKGGWYYDKNQGIVKINLTEPLHHYIWYIIGNRNQKPCEW